MFTYLAITVIFNLFIATAFFLLRRNLHPLEILASWLFTLAILHVLNDVIFVNDQAIQLVPEKTLFWSVEVDRFFFIPFLTVWLWDCYLSNKLNFIKKIILTLVWFLSLSGYLYLNRALGYFHFSGWHARDVFGQWLILYAIVFAFAIGFRLLLKKEAFLHDLS